MRKRYLIVAAALLVVVPLAAWYWRDTSQPEVDKLATLLEWKSGRTIAEIGAGKGEMTVAAAERVGHTGHVFSNELDSKRLTDIQAAVAKRKLTNVAIVQAGEADTNLPP